MKELFLNIKQALGRAWWVKISTKSPDCTYFFGPFLSQEEAAATKPGYVEDLKEESVGEISVAVLQCKEPESLTVFNEAEDAVNPNWPVALSRQA